MSDKEFVKVPQVEIDGKKYHESAKVMFGFNRDVKVEDVGGNKKVTRTYSLVKYVVVRDKVQDETVLRSEEGGRGRIIIENLMDMETKKEMKRLESLKKGE